MKKMICEHVQGANDLQDLLFLSFSPSLIM